VFLLSDIRKFTHCSWREKQLFVEAFLLLGLFRLLIISLPFKRIVWLLSLSAGEGSAASNAESLLFLSNASWAIHAAAARTPWESVCLGQALAGVAMLRLRGLTATLYLGVAKDESVTAAITAHAWLRSGEFILTGAGNHKRYTVINVYSSS